MLSVSETYLNSRAIRVPDAVKRKGAAVGVWPATVARWVSAIRRAQRRTHHTWNAAIALERAFKRAGPDAQPVLGALVHGLRHTYATELAGSDVSVYTLMKLLGHESMTTSQRHVAAAGTETHSAAAKNPIYVIIRSHRRPDQQSDNGSGGGHEDSSSTNCLQFSTTDPVNSAHEPIHRR